MLEENPMKTIIAVPATVLTVLLMLPVGSNAQTPPKASTFTVAGHAGEAQLLQVKGKSYVEVQALARLTKGTLSFKADRTTLTLPIRLEREGSFRQGGSDDTHASAPGNSR